MRRYVKDPAKYPQIPFDLVKEAVLSGVVVLVLVVAAALVFNAPYVKPLTIQKVATSEPVLFLQTAAHELDNTSTVAQYGPPYNNGTGSLQSVGAFHPQTLLGVTFPVNPEQVDVLKPLSMASKLDPGLTALLAQWRQASTAQQQSWVNNYLAALQHATVNGSAVSVPAAADGPVPQMLSALRALGTGGLMAGALDRLSPVYRYDVAPSLLFLQGSALTKMAQHYDLLGGQWGIMHDELSYPGPWWLTPYSALYQIPPYSTSSAGDMMAAYTMLVVLLILLTVPFIPGLKDLPRKLRIYRIVWRDWYRSVEPHSGPTQTQAGPERKGHAS